MFTGLVQALGQVAELGPRGGDVRMQIAPGGLDLKTLAVGDSVAISGVCLTLVELLGDGFTVDVSRETLACTTLGQWRAGTAVNLEQALTPTALDSKRKTVGAGLTLWLGSSWKYRVDFERQSRDGSRAFSGVDPARLTRKDLVDDVQPCRCSNDERHPDVHGADFAHVAEDQHGNRCNQETPEERRSHHSDRRENEIELDDLQRHRE